MVVEKGNFHNFVLRRLCSLHCGGPLFTGSMVSTLQYMISRMTSAVQLKAMVLSGKVKYPSAEVSEKVKFHGAGFVVYRSRSAVWRSCSAVIRSRSAVWRSCSTVKRSSSAVMRQCSTEVQRS